MRIREFSVKDVKGVEEVTINMTQRNCVVIGGKNGQGKSSAIDAVMSALFGKKVMEGPLYCREGEEEGVVTVTIEGDNSLGLPPLKVTRYFSKTGTGSETTKVEIREERSYGDSAPSAAPQDLLNLLAQHSTSDPMVFLQAKPKEQREILFQQLGIDFSEQDKERKELYAQRREVNRQVESHKAYLATLVTYDDADEEVCVDELFNEQADLVRQSEEHRAKEQAHKDAARNCEEAARKLAEAEEAIDRAEYARDRAHELLGEAEEACRQAIDEVDKSTPPNMEDIASRIKWAVEHNKKVEANRTYKNALEMLGHSQKEASDLTDKLDKIDENKREAIASANMPTEGITFNEDGLLFHNRPLCHASQAEQMRVALAVALARRPELPVVFMKNGALLDEDSLGMAAQMANDMGFQLIVEVVGDNADVVIEKGRVKNAGTE